MLFHFHPDTFGEDVAILHEDYFNGWEKTWKTTTSGRVAVGDSSCSWLISWATSTKGHGYSKARSLQSLGICSLLLKRFVPWNITITMKLLCCECFLLCATAFLDLRSTEFALQVSGQFSTRPWILTPLLSRLVPAGQGPPCWASLTEELWGKKRDENQ